MVAESQQSGNLTVVGIDFSLNSPAICRHTGNTWNIANCEFFFLTGNKKLATSYANGMFKGELFATYSTDTERFLNNAAALKKWINPTENMQIGIEGYAFGARGSRIFQIGEATGMLKTLVIHSSEGALINNGKNLACYPPSHVKKFATGKGSAPKEMMVEAFIKDTGLDLINILGMKRLGNPVHDLIDAYWIACLMFRNLTK